MHQLKYILTTWLKCYRLRNAISAMKVHNGRPPYRESHGARKRPHRTISKDQLSMLQWFASRCIKGSNTDMIMLVREIRERGPCEQ